MGHFKDEDEAFRAGQLCGHLRFREKLARDLRDDAAFAWKNGDLSLYRTIQNLKAYNAISPGIGQMDPDLVRKAEDYLIKTSRVDPEPGEFQRALEMGRRRGIA